MKIKQKEIWLELLTFRIIVCYGQADAYGDVDILFSLSVADHTNIEVNLKNADNVALLEPSHYGVPAEWILGTGQGWDYVLYGATTIP